MSISLSSLSDNLRRLRFRALIDEVLSDICDQLVISGHLHLAKEAEFEKELISEMVSDGKCDLHLQELHTILRVTLRVVKASDYPKEIGKCLCHVREALRTTSGSSLMDHLDKMIESMRHE